MRFIPNAETNAHVLDGRHEELSEQDDSCSDSDDIDWDIADQLEELVALRGYTRPRASLAHRLGLHHD